LDNCLMALNSYIWGGFPYWRDIAESAEVFT
jgi:hypothetical protein